MPHAASTPLLPRVLSPDTLRGSPKTRTPPGQSLTTKWPVLHHGPVEHVDPETSSWRLKVFGACDEPYGLTWRELMAMPQVDVVCDMHCVTHWSRLDNVFTGVPTRLLIERARPHPDVRFVMCHAERGFTVNVPIEEFTREDCLLAHGHDGQPLTAEHGAPLRAIVPRLYLWKSCKWIRGIELRRTDAPGFWEQGGYHMHGDPWREQRFGW